MRQAYSQTGIIHIVSISGSHVAVLFYIVSAMLWWLRGKKYLAIKYTIAVFPVWFYVLMAGGAPSATRSAAMFSVLALGYLLKRHHNPLNTLLATAFILLMANPAWLFSVGFQLSFIAVLSLIIFYSPVRKLLKPSGKIFIWLWNATAASLAAEILVAPLVIYYFHSFPLMFLAANILAALSMTILLIAGMCLIVCSWLPPLAGFIATVCELITISFNKVIYFLQRFSPPALNTLCVSVLELILIYLFIAGLSSVWLKQKRRAIFLALSASCLLMLLLCTDKWHLLHQDSLIIYNTGKLAYSERITGNTFNPLLDSLPNEKLPYAVNNAHIGFGAGQKMSSSDCPVFTFDGQKILVLKKAISSYPDSFPVDLLIVAAPLKKLDFDQTVQTFHPRQIVLTSGQPHWLAGKWSDRCLACHILLHDVTRDGAFVLARTH
jgi:competence protein ComEC